MLRRLLLPLFLTAALAACTVPDASVAGEKAASEVAQTGADAAARPDPTDWRIDGDTSWVHVRVYRSGRLARFGHNHVVSSHSLAGWVRPTPRIEDTRFEVTLPLASMVVDDAAARALEGAEFSAPVPDSDRAATRANMLGPDLLNAGRYPMIRVRSIAVRGGPDAAVATTSIALAGATVEVGFPIEVSRSASALTVRGEVSVTHEQLGLTPYSALLGALRVRDDIGLRFELTATPFQEDMTL
ncbi:MAG: YceI family protein [Pseudomonadota bacterium]